MEESKKEKSGDNPTTKKKVTQSTRAGLQFPVGAIARVMKERTSTDRVGGAAPIFMAAVLEYLMAELCELVGNAAKQRKKQRIIPRDIMMAISNDDELKRLTPCVVVAMGGAHPNIHDSLLPKTRPILSNRKPSDDPKMGNEKHMV